MAVAVLHYGKSQGLLGPNTENQWLVNLGVSRPLVYATYQFFGGTGALIIDRYFSEPLSEFENIIFNPTQLPELKEAGIEVDMLTEEQLQELRVSLQ